MKVTLVFCAIAHCQEFDSEVKPRNQALLTDLVSATAVCPKRFKTRAGDLKHEALK